ncbi:MAG: ribosome maturation factor RimP [Holosporaceae bacterium]|jgi:ribosome maturation factor RimP|nr:ribosome maturation factor RimP [Holosporaceae bacterium]
MALEEKIINAVESSLNHRGYEIVRVRIFRGKKLALTIEIDRIDGDPVNIEDCSSVSHLISAILDVENFINSAYILDITSPGEYRPLTKISDFERFLGKCVSVEVVSAVNNRRKFEGQLQRVEQNSNDSVVYLKEECDTGGVRLLYSNIKKASVKRF